MDFEAEEVVRLREEILRFVLQQLKESAASGELRSAAEELAAPIEAAVQRALINAQAAKAPNSGATNRLNETELSQIARAVAAQLDGKAKAAVAPAAPNDGESDPSVQDFSIYASPEPARPRRRLRWDPPHLMAAAIALLAGIVIGIGIERLLASSEDPGMVDSESAQPISKPYVTATGAADPREEDGPAASSSPTVASQGQQ